MIEKNNHPRPGSTEKLLRREEFLHWYDNSYQASDYRKAYVSNLVLPNTAYAS